MALEKPTQLNEKRLQVRKPDGLSNVEYMLAMRDGRRRLNGPSVGGDRAPLSFTNGDMPTEEDLNGWSVFVPQGGSYDVFLSSGIHPKAPPSRFTVKPTADQPSMKKLIAVCIALLVGACGVLHYNFADVRPSFAGSMHGIGYHEWVGGAGSSGRRRTPYSFKEQATAQGMKFATQLHRDYMPQLRAGNDDSSSALLCSTALTTAPSLPPSLPPFASPPPLRTHGRRAAWLLVFATVACFWQCSDSLCNEPHYDTGDVGPSQALWFWSDGSIGPRRAAYFVLPNHGIAVELGACTIAWRGDLVLHATHTMDAGKSNPARRLLSVWNGAGGKLLRSLYDNLYFTSNTHGKNVWEHIPRFTRVIVMQRVDGEKHNGEWSKATETRYHYGVVWSTPKDGAQPQLTMGPKGRRSETTAFVNVRLDRDKKKKKNTPVDYTHVRLLWEKIANDPIAINALKAATVAVPKESFDVDALIAESARKRQTFVADARRGATTSRGKTRKRKKSKRGGGQSKRGKSKRGGARQRRSKKM